jgi:hypothetical protein
MVFDEGAQKQKSHDTVSVKIMYPTVHLSIRNVMYAVYTLKGVYISTCLCFVNPSLKDINT